MGESDGKTAHHDRADLQVNVTTVAVVSARDVTQEVTFPEFHDVGGVHQCEGWGPLTSRRGLQRLPPPGKNLPDHCACGHGRSAAMKWCGPRCPCVKAHRPCTENCRCDPECCEHRGPGTPVRL